MYNVFCSSRTESHPKSNAQEYFAESFKYYIENPESVEYAAPKTYNFIKKVTS